MGAARLKREEKRDFLTLETRTSRKFNGLKEFTQKKEHDISAPRGGPFHLSRLCLHVFFFCGGGEGARDAFGFFLALDRCGG